MTADMQPGEPLPVRLRRARLAAALEGGTARPWERIAWYAGVAQRDPEGALAGLEAVAAEQPNDLQALIAILEVHVRTGDPAPIEATLARIAALDARKPVWLERFAEAWRTGRIEMDGIALGVDRRVVAPAILRGFAEGDYELREATAAAALVRPGDRVLELGAGVGYVAVATLARQPDVVWHAVEANPALVPLIEENRRLNGVSFTIENAAWGDRDGPVALHGSRRGFWAASLLADADATDPVEVPGVDAARGIAAFRPTVLVMDVEGAEYAIIERADLGAVERMVVEFHPGLASDRVHTRALGRLIAAGFVVDTALSGGDVLCLRRDAADTDPALRASASGT